MGPYSHLLGVIKKMAIITLAIAAIISAMCFYFGQKYLLILHRNISSAQKKDIFNILVFLPINAIIVFLPHFLYLSVELWEGIEQGRVVLVLFQLIALFYVVTKLYKKHEKNT